MTPELRYMHNIAVKTKFIREYLHWHANQSTVKKPSLPRWFNEAAFWREMYSGEHIRETNA